MRFARGKGILCQGRGSAANSAVCYCLYVTEVDPARMNVLFERFISVERREPPDIDIDFEHQRREDVMQYIYAKYGRHRAALTGVVTSYRTKSLLRDVGKALGLRTSSSGSQRPRTAPMASGSATHACWKTGWILPRRRSGSGWPSRTRSAASRGT